MLNKLAREDPEEYERVMAEKEGREYVPKNRPSEESVDADAPFEIGVDNEDEPLGADIEYENEYDEEDEDNDMSPTSENVTGKAEPSETPVKARIQNKSE